MRWAGSSSSWCMRLGRSIDALGRRALGVNRTLKRYTQFVLWVILAPALGLVQGIAAFAGVMMRFDNLGDADLHRLFLGLSLIYGGGWFLPALLISDLAVSAFGG